MGRERTIDDGLDEIQDLERNGTPFHPSMDGRSPEKDATPDELTELLNSLGMVSEFTVNINRVIDGKKVFCGKKISILPEMHSVGEEYGPGEYFLYVSWNVPGQKPPRWKRLHYIIDQSYMTIHREWLAARNPNIPANSTNSLETDLERLSKLQSIVGGKKDDSSLILELIREQNKNNEKRIDQLTEQMRESQKETKDMIKELVSGLKTALTPQAQPQPKSLVEQLKEYREVSTLLGLPGVAAPETPVDDRPVWMQAIEMIGDKALPLLEAFAKSGGLKRRIAESKLEKVMAPGNPVVDQLMANRDQQLKFIAEVCERATTPEAKLGAVNLAKRLGLPLPPGFGATE